jgi:ParB family chromosome partitioning protein
LLSEPQLALRVMVAHAICGSVLWQARPEPQKVKKEATAESIANSKVQAAFDAARTEILKLLELPEDRKTVVVAFGTDIRIEALLSTLIRLSDADVMRVLAFVMAETLASGTNLIEQIGCHLKVDMTRLWEPEDAFFDLLRDKAALNEILKETGGKDIANANISATANVQKQAIRDSLEEEGGEANETWVPRYLKFPFETYTNAGVERLSENALRCHTSSG